MDTKFMIAMVAAVFLFDMGLQVLQGKKRDKLLKKLSELMANKEFEEFEKLIDSDEVRKAFPIYNRNFLKLNEAFLKEDKDAISEAFQSFSGLTMNKVQKEALYQKAFYYYLSIKDKGNCRAYYDLLKDLGVKDQETLDIMYDTYILNGYKYLDQLLEKCGEGKDPKNLPIYSILADVYRNKGEEVKAKEYEDLVIELSEEIRNRKTV